MKSLVVQDSQKMGDQYFDGFPFPKPDSFGVCNNYNSAHFMMDDQSQCIQMANLETQCETLLNAQYYSEKLSYYLGQGAKVADNKVVETGNIFTYDEATAVYTIKAAGTTVASVASKAADCTCSNYLREIEYTVDLEMIKTEDASVQPYYQIKKITADIVLGSAPLSSTCSESKGVNQKFSVFFQSLPSELEIIQKKSGNPGYFDGFPLKVGYLEATEKEAGGPISSYQDGFVVSGANMEGDCYNAESVLLKDYADPVLKYKEDLSYGCSTLKDKATLESECVDSDTIKGLQIFKNLEQLTNFGQFGNANIYFKNDWVQVTEDSSFANLGKATWDSTTKSCKVYSSALVKIVYHKMGFSENMQEYVIDVKKYAIEEKWTYPDNIIPDSQSSQKMRYNHYVQF